jgi:hypothetical protein
MHVNTVKGMKIVFRDGAKALMFAVELADLGGARWMHRDASTSQGTDK